MSGGDGSHPRELLSAYLDDELAVEERAAVDRHLALCEPCRKQLRSLKALAAAVGDEDVPEVPLDLARRIGVRIDEAAKVVPAPARRKYFLPASIAATIGAVGILLAIQWRERAPVPVRPAEAPAAPPAERQKFETPPEPFPQAAPVEPERSAVSSEERKRDRASEAEPSSDPLPPPPVRPEMSRPREEVAAVQERDAAAAAPSPAVGEAAGAAGAFSADALRAKVASSACGERWIDTGVLAAWRVVDAARAERELADLARRLGGRIERVEPYVDQLALIVPRARVPEMTEALARIGVRGLDATISPEEGFECVRQRISVE